MRLIRLRLLNFRQHARTEIEFGTGLLGIIGPNGSGKSTILEAIAWAIYGTAAARGTSDTIRFNRAPSRSRVEVELVLEIAGHEYRVVRTLRTAEVFLNGDDSPVARSLGGVTEYLERRIGMSRDEFFNTYFTGQNELQFLAQMGPTQRGRFLGQVLGYERLRLAQERVRVRRNELRHEIDGLRAGLPDPDALRIEREAAEQRGEEAAKALEGAERAGRKATERLTEIRPRWEAAQTARERAAVLGRRAERRRSLEGRVRALDKEIGEAERRLETLEEAPGYLDRYREELEAARAALAEAGAEVDRVRGAWTEQRGEATTRLQAYRDRAHELKEQVRRLREAGPEGICPTCERPLGKNFDAVVERLEDEWEVLVQDGRWLKSRVDQLQAEPESLAAATAVRAEAQAQVEDRNQLVARCERAIQELRRLRAAQARREKERESVQNELATLPTDDDHRREAEALDFDREAYQALRREYEAAVSGDRKAELRVTEARGLLVAAREALETAVRAEAEYRERSERLEALEVEYRHHNELDTAMSALRAELNARVRPELGVVASEFLTEITDARYTALEVDDDYNILVLDEGEEKPVISGGEEDIANLVLRLAISQMIAERTGRPLSVLILDEVFGSLDIEHRDNIIQLLHRLGARFEQVILITHIESIQEGLDRVIHVDYDERTGSSVVEEGNG